MAIVVRCPGCRARLQVGDERAGGHVPCPRCRESVAVPAASPAPAPPAFDFTQLSPDPAPPPAPAPAPPPRDPTPGRWSDPRLLLGTIAACVMLLGAGVYGLGAALKSPAQVVTLAAVWPKVAPPPAPPTPPPKTRPTRARPSPLPSATQPTAVQPLTQGGQPGKTEFGEVQLAQAQARPVRLAVNPRGADDVGAILTSLGKGYPFTTLDPADLESEARLAQFDVLFLNCSGKVGDPERTSTALRQFVAGGKTLYASDMQYGQVSKAFPDAADPKSMARGAVGDYKAEVVDEGLRAQLGPTVDLHFNTGVRSTPFVAPDAVTVLRSADNAGRVKAGVPLLVKFGHGNGQVIFTAFHNSAIAGDTAKKLLRYLVFSSVLAEAEGRVRRVLARDGFAVKTADVLTAADAGWTTTKTITVPTAGTVRVGVAFNSEGASVELVLEGPGGLRFTRAGADAFLAEVRHAPAGEWRATVTARGVPYPNFPLTLLTTDPKAR